MTGLVSRFIWIWPTWDRDRTSRAASHESQTVELGWFSTDESSKKADFCRCDSVPVDAGAGGMTLRRCAYNNETSDEEMTMSPERCRVKISYMSESVSADHAIDRLTASPGWIAAHDVGGVIIDIDEDFFGCESPSDQLADRLGNELGGWRNVELIDAALARFLCPHSAEDESAADRLARRLVGLVMDLCQRRRTADRCRPSALDALVRSAFVGRPSMFCRKTVAEIRATWTSLAEILVLVPPAHLKNVLDVGFCLNTAPRTHNFGREPNNGDFIVCYGANEPNSTLVYRHTPSHVELDAQLRSFDRLVTELLSQTKDLTGRDGSDRRLALLVTVCRSVRDGYTPRFLAGRIEHGILSALRRHRGTGSLTIVYDKDLLSGREGWNSRPR